MTNHEELKELSDSFFHAWKGEYQKIVDEMSKKYSMSPTAFSFIVFLKNHPGIQTASEVCKCSFLKRGIISTIVDDLCSRNLMIQKRDSEDKRMQKIYLTEEGLRIGEEANEKIGSIFKDATSDFTSEDWEAIPSILNKMVNKLKTRGESNE